MKKHFICAVYGLFIIVGVFFISYLELGSKDPNNKKKPTQLINNQKELKQKICVLPTRPARNYLTSKIKKINLKVDDNGFSQNYVKVNMGSLIEIDLQATEGYHNFNLDQYGICTPHLTTGKSQKIIFFADKAGMFKFYSDTSRYKEHLNIAGTISIQ